MFFFFQAEDGIRDHCVTGVQTCALPIYMLKQGLAQVLMGADAQLLMTYHLGGGSDSDRKAGARWLQPMFGDVDARQLVVCPGAQAAIAALVLALTEPGDVILTEPTSYPGLRAAAAQFGRRIIAVQADSQGIMPERLEQACRQHRPGLVYRSEEHTSELQSHSDLVCRLLLEKKKSRRSATTCRARKSGA